MVDKLPTLPPLDTDERPSSLAECFNDDGELLIQQYRDFLQREEEEELYEMNLLNSFVSGDDDDDNCEQPKKKKSKTRKCKARQPLYIDDDGVRRTLDPRQSMWFIYYIQHPPLDDLTFDDLEEYTAINEETHRQFLHLFIDYGSKDLFDDFVNMPTNAAEYETHSSEFSAGGLPGAGFSTDATNVMMWRCQHNLRKRFNVYVWESSTLFSAAIIRARKMRKMGQAFFCRYPPPTAMGDGILRVFSENRKELLLSLYRPPLRSSREKRPHQSMANRLRNARKDNHGQFRKKARTPSIPKKDRTVSSEMRK